MAIEITGCHFENNGTGIKAPTSADIKMSNTSFKNNGKGIDIYISASDLEHLNLPSNTPHEYILEVIQILQGQKDQPKEIQIKSLADSSLFKWLGHTANIASISSALISFVQSL